MLSSSSVSPNTFSSAAAAFLCRHRFPLSLQLIDNRLHGRRVTGCSCFGRRILALIVVTVSSSIARMLAGGTSLLCGGLDGARWSRNTRRGCLLSLDHLHLLYFVLIKVHNKLGHHRHVVHNHWVGCCDVSHSALARVQLVRTQVEL